MSDHSSLLPLGHELVGSGPQPVIVLNDWLCDTSTWDGARGYLDQTRFTYAFTDLRGYGRSRGRTGAFSLAEATTDVLAVADAHGWDQFMIVGHSMSTLVALRLAQQQPARVLRTVLLTPPPPRGFRADEATLARSYALALADDEARLAVWQRVSGGRLSAGWVAHKVARWRATSDASAVRAYVDMFSTTGLGEPAERVGSPVLAITGAHDAEPMRADASRAALGEFCAQLSVLTIADAGHYPMQETPPLLVALVERFLSS
jgi:3-oxoadipate enol-lactonase